MGCGAACSSEAPCPSGLYCADGLCSAECAPATVARDCGDRSACTVDGKCESDPSADGGTGNGDGSDGDGDGNACPSLELNFTPRTPNVFLIVDQSSSMNEGFGSSNRWDVLKAALLSNDGLIAELEAKVRFGLVLYSGADEEATCPLLTRTPLAIRNLEAIRSVYQPADVIEDTPTGDAINAVTNSAEVRKLLGPDARDPTIYILATDGEPDTCEQLDPQEGQQEAIAAVKTAFQRGIRTYVIAVAEEDDLSQAHVRDMANAGLGVDQGELDAPSFRVNDDQGLRDALNSIVRGVISCSVPLNGRITGEDPCVGTVTLDGEALECGGPNGWRLENESSVEIRGTACTRFKAGSALSATFPCGTAVVE